jgi:DHA2 family multidrug resistance protein
VTSLLVPFTRDYSAIIVLQALRGLAVGAFIPASLGIILRRRAPRWWIWGLAAYAFRFVFSQTIAGSIEAVYSEGGAWQWIFWQNAVFTPVITALVWYAMPREDFNRTLLHQMDWRGLAFVGIGLGIICAGLVCPARPRQPARLAQFRRCQRAVRGRRLAGDRLYRDRFDGRISGDPIAGRGQAQCR